MMNSKKNLVSKPIKVSVVRLQNEFSEPQKKTQNNSKIIKNYVYDPIKRIIQ